MVNAPESSVTAKYGWSSTRTHASIQGCTSHLTLKVSTALGESTAMPGSLLGWALLNAGLIIDNEWMLCRNGSSFLMDSAWPVMIATTCGVYMQPFWLITTVSLATSPGTSWPSSFLSET